MVIFPILFMSGAKAEYSMAVVHTSCLNLILFFVYSEFSYGFPNVIHDEFGEVLVLVILLAMKFLPIIIRTKSIFSDTTFQLTCIDDDHSINLVEFSFHKCTSSQICVL